MKAMVVADHHYYRTPDGQVYVPTVYDYEFWKRYLLTFDKVRVVVRLTDVDTVPQNMLLSSGPGIEFYALPEFRGPVQFLFKRKELKERAARAFESCDCAIFRIPCPIAGTVYKQFKKTKKPFAVEVVADPEPDFTAISFKSFVYLIAAILWTKEVRRMCLEANGVSYVTEWTLQEKYPNQAKMGNSSSSYFETHYSSITLKSSFFGESRRYKGKHCFTIIHTANSMNTYAKGHIVLLDALKMVLDKGYNVNVVFIGDGKLRKKIERHAIKIGVGKNVRFTGLLPGSEMVRNELLKGDMFVFPTLSEGLPRAVIEAMAVGLPCISTPVGGIHELLEPEFLLNPHDVAGFANKIIELIENPRLMEEMSERNLRKAQHYEEHVLNKRRSDFYSKLCTLAQNKSH